MKKVICSILIVCLVLALGCTFVACQGKEKPQEKVKYTVMAPDGAPAMALAYMMKTDAKVDGHTMDYQIIDGTNVAPAMTNKEADFIIAPTNAGVAMCFNTSAYQLMATTSWGNLYIVSVDSSFKTLEQCDNDATAFLKQFEAKPIETIGTNQVPDITLNYLLGLADSNANVVNGGDALNIQANLKNNKISTAVLGEPAVTATLTQAPNAVRLASISDLWQQLTGLAFPQASLFVKKSIVESDPAAVRAMAAAVQQSIAYLNASKDNALELGNYMASRGDSSLKGAVVANSYLQMRQQYKSAQDVQADVKAFVGVLNSKLAAKDYSDIFVK